MKTHFAPFTDVEDIEQAPCGTWLGEAPSLSGDWAMVDCRLCHSRRERITAAAADEERFIIEHMGDMAAFMRAEAEASQENICTPQLHPLSPLLRGGETIGSWSTFNSNPAGPADAPCQRSSHRLTRARLESLLMKRRAARGVYTDEHLRVTRSRQSHLDIYERSIVECFVMSPMVKRRVSPRPKDITANSHAVLLRL